MSQRTQTSSYRLYSLRFIIKGRNECGIAGGVFLTVFHVAKDGKQTGSGTRQDPFLTIQQAADCAVAGDTIKVHEGTYRETVQPKNAGLSDTRRIVYQACEGEKVIIKGSEVIANWEHVEGTVWKAVISNQLFGAFNPFKEIVFGDWLFKPKTTKYLGDVYLDGMSLYQADSLEALAVAKEQKEVVDHWTKETVKVKHIKQTKYQWYSEVKARETHLYANFHETDPTKSLVEISVRQTCFYPVEKGMHYITVKGFEMCHAATPWSPPTADQVGLIGPHWSKGWIIEDNVIHDAKCSAISLGKDGSTGDNFSSKRKDKPGYHYQIESVFLGLEQGWSKEHVGSHVIRRNTIYDCGQNAIMGHLGCINSEISDNHIYQIGIKREFYGHEIAGIKLHAAIDTTIEHNLIHDCSLGLWLDWQTQGTRVSRNICFSNSRDAYIEVSHGPYVVDHNIFASNYALDNYAQGGAYINNLIVGKMVHRKILNRSTPYHHPHSTRIKGFAVVHGGDDRYYNNVFVGDVKNPGMKAGKNNAKVGVGTAHYDGYATSLDEYIENVHKKPGDVEIYLDNEQPVYINRNAYYNGAQPFHREKKKITSADLFSVSINQTKVGIYLNLDIPKGFDRLASEIESTKSLGRVRIADQDFETKDGGHLRLDKDLKGKEKQEKTVLGPLSRLEEGKASIKLWCF